jgi:hypothetical protein
MAGRPGSGLRCGFFYYHAMVCLRQAGNPTGER